MTSTALAAGTALTSGWLYAVPFIVAKKSVVNSMMVNVSTGVASTAVRLGIYSDDGTVYPGTLVAETSTQPATTTSATLATAGFTTNPTLNVGIHWLVINTSGAANLRVVPVASAIPILGIENVAATLTPGTGWQIARAYAALTSPFPVNAGVMTTNIPAIYVRVQS